jgi:hypothetical protein
MYGIMNDGSTGVSFIYYGIAGMPKGVAGQEQESSTLADII